MLKIKKHSPAVSQMSSFCYQGTVTFSNEVLLILKTMEGKTLRLLKKYLGEEFKGIGQKDEKVRVNIRAWTRDFNYTALYVTEIYKISQFVGNLQKSSRHDTAEITGEICGKIKIQNQHEQYPVEVVTIQDKQGILNYIRYNPDELDLIVGEAASVRVELQNSSYWVSHITDKGELELSGFDRAGYYFCDKLKSWTDKDGVEHTGKEYATIFKVVTEEKND